MRMHRAHNHAADVSRDGLLSPLLGDSATVERSAPGRAPTAFRIWRAGANPTDMGVHTFTPASAEAIMAAQAERRNLFPIDVEHFSMRETAPLEVRGAVGWFTVAVRPDATAAPELWAVDVEWSAEVRRGLEASPPGWRYFSPVYRTDDAGEITAFFNLAITNNPATHAVTALASLSARNRLEARCPALSPSDRLFLARVPIGVVQAATRDPSKVKATVKRLERLERMAIAMGALTRLAVVHCGTRSLFGVRVLADPTVFHRLVQTSATTSPKEKAMRTTTPRDAGTATIMTTAEREAHLANMRKRMGVATDDGPTKLGVQHQGTVQRFGVRVPA